MNVVAVVPAWNEGEVVNDVIIELKTYVNLVIGYVLSMQKIIKKLSGVLLGMLSRLRCWHWLG
jgi:hypothetical protein